MIRVVIASSIVLVSSVAPARAAPLRLAEAQAEAREHAPERAVADAEIGATKARASAASRLFTNDPVLSGGYTREVFAGDGDERGWSVGVEWAIDLPWLCGTDPVITGELTRVN